MPPALRRLSSLCLLCSFLPLPTRVRAQEPAGLDEIAAGIEPGTRIRVWAPPDDPLEGALLGIRDRRVVLRVDAPAAGAEAWDGAAAFPSIEALWTRSRRTKTGAIVGGAAGVAGGVLFGLFVAGISESDVNAGSAAAVGGLLGAGAGAALGALVGSAFSGWKLRYEAPADGRGWDPPRWVPDAGGQVAWRGDGVRAEPWPDRTGWLVAHAGGSAWTGREASDPSSSGGLGGLVGAGIVADFGAWRVGPEVLLSGLGDSQSVVSYGGVLHVRLGHGRLEPYGIAGAGGQSWDASGAGAGQVDASLFALNGGLGLRAPAGRLAALGVELRAHRSVQSYAGSVPWLFTLAATLGVGL